MRPIALLLTLILAAVPVQAQAGKLTHHEVSQFPPDWQPLLRECREVERQLAIVELRCPTLVPTGGHAFGVDWSKVQRVTVNTLDGTILKVQSRRSYIRALFASWLTIVAGAAAAAIYGASR